jgi:hypothetical protein
MPDPAQPPAADRLRRGPHCRHSPLLLETLKTCRDRGHAYATTGVPQFAKRRAWTNQMGLSKAATWKATPFHVTVKPHRFIDFCLRRAGREM